MKNGTLKICLLIVTLYGFVNNAGASLSDTTLCAIATYSCTGQNQPVHKKKKALCDKASLNNTAAEIKIWDANQLSYISQAKGRGLTCGVVPGTSSSQSTFCTNFISECSTSKVCDRATDRGRWKSNSNKYVVEAKKRGLSCGIDSSSPKPVVETEVTKPMVETEVTTPVVETEVTTPAVETKVTTPVVETKVTKPVVETKVTKLVPIVPTKKQKKQSEPLASLNNPLHFKNYGNTYHTPLLPNVIFFIGEIKDGDERGFRKALRNHKVDTVVLISDGGLVYNGLRLANIINDNNLSTYVPLGERCASACSFMFFAGNSKVAHGGLGVHQFYAEDQKKIMTVGKVQKGTQYLVADIIENLEAFGTPASVYPKMFSTSGMYFFSEEEKSTFSNNAINPDLVSMINEVLVYFSKSLDTDFDDSTLDRMPTKMKNSLTQLELVRIGCMEGPIDGIKGEATSSAIQLFSSKINSDIPAGKFSDLFRVLNRTKVGACY